MAGGSPCEPKSSRGFHDAGAEIHLPDSDSPRRAPSADATGSPAIRASASRFSGASFGSGGSTPERPASPFHRDCGSRRAPQDRRFARLSISCITMVVGMAFCSCVSSSLRRSNSACACWNSGGASCARIVGAQPLGLCFRPAAARLLEQRAYRVVDSQSLDFSGVECAIVDAQVVQSAAETRPERRVTDLERSLWINRGRRRVASEPAIPPRLPSRNSCRPDALPEPSYTIAR